MAASSAAPELASARLFIIVAKGVPRAVANRCRAVPDLPLPPSDRRGLGLEPACAVTYLRDGPTNLNAGVSLQR